MMVMVEGRHRKQEALDMLNNSYHKAKGLTLLRQAVDEDHLEAIYLLGMIYISRGPHQCDEVPDDGEYTSVVDSVKELLRAIDVVHRLTTNNITFQCEYPHHSVKCAFAIGHEKDEDRQKYCMVCRWYVEYELLLGGYYNSGTQGVAGLR
ncbi:unnamed protein product [Lactuca saligna]|uniref:Uncharacterized protein n=1 Tax=Lactuca saligna TaxID=75948 RepID=A0AA35ZTT0_LACSI|nr:unnamed protein product [Lactuca saligna]